MNMFVYILLVNFIALSHSSNIRSLDDIPELIVPNVHIRDSRELLNKINTIISEGGERLVVVSDFDQTLTADPGEVPATVLNSYEMFRLLPSIPQSYKDEDTNLFLKYRPFEQNPNLTAADKSKYMLEWYQESENLMRGLKFPRQELAELAANVTASFRKGVDRLVSWSRAAGVPLLVLSSGLGDAVRAMLDAAGLHTPNVKIISNFLDIDENDIIRGRKGSPIHSYNKAEAISNSTAYFINNFNGDNYCKASNQRRNVLLLGDSPGDADMAAGLPHSTQLKLAFLSRRRAALLSHYLTLFDVVIQHDQTMDVVNAIIQLVH